MDKDVEIMVAREGEFRKEERRAMRMTRDKRDSSEIFGRKLWGRERKWSKSVTSYEMRTR